MRQGEGLPVARWRGCAQAHGPGLLSDAGKPLAYLVGKVTVLWGDRELGAEAAFAYPQFAEHVLGMGHEVGVDIDRDVDIGVGGGKILHLPPVR